MSNHLLLCGNKTEQCPRCQRFVRRAIFAYHCDNRCTDPGEIESPQPPIPQLRLLEPTVQRFTDEFPSSTNDDSAFVGRRNVLRFASTRLKMRKFSFSTLLTGYERNSILLSAASRKTVECEFCHAQYDRTEYSKHTVSSQT